MPWRGVSFPASRGDVLGPFRRLESSAQSVDITLRSLTPLRSPRTPANYKLQNCPLLFVSASRGSGFTPDVREETADRRRPEFKLTDGAVLPWFERVVSRFGEER